MPGAFEVDQVGQRQDIANEVFNVRADETPFTSMVPKRKRPLKKLTQWQVEDYPDPSHAGIMDGADVESFESTPRVMLEGIAQKFRRPWFVSDFADVTTVAGLPSGEKGRQKAIAAIVLKLMIEARALSAEECSEDNGTDTPNATRGAFMWMSVSEQALRPVPAAYRPASACVYSSTLAALTETAFEACLAAAYKARRGKLDLDGFVGIELKQKFDNWTARDSEATTTNVPVRTFNQDSSKNAIIKVVDFFKFSTGTIRVHLSSHLRLGANGAASAYTHKSGLFIDRKMWALGFMRDPGMRELPDLGGGPRGYSDAIATLECHNPLGQVVLSIGS
jgi:hypothetical protein